MREYNGPETFLQSPFNRSIAILSFLPDHILTTRPLRGFSLEHGLLAGELPEPLVLLLQLRLEGSVQVAVPVDLRRKRFEGGARSLVPEGLE